MCRGLYEREMTEVSGVNDKNIQSKEVFTVIREQYNNIFSAEKKVVDFILQYPQKAVNSNVSELAKLSGVSDATVIRMCHHIGYTGYYQFRITLARDLGKRQYDNVEPDGEADAVEKMFAEYAEVMTAIGKRISIDVISACVRLLKECDHAHILAVGNTSPLAQYMGYRLGKIGIKCTYNVASEYFMNHINLADKEDILIAISKSGETEQIVQGMEFGKNKGLKSIAITSSMHSTVAGLADYVLLTSGQEELFNNYKGFQHLNETAVIDALINFTINEELLESPRPVSKRDDGQK